MAEVGALVTPKQRRFGKQKRTCVASWGQPPMQRLLEDGMGLSNVVVERGKQ
jgi:hypothetical protein